MSKSLTRALVLGMALILLAGTLLPPLVYAGGIGSGVTQRKPQRWAPISPGLVAPEWRWTWEGLTAFYPAWEGTGGLNDVSRNRLSVATSAPWGVGLVGLMQAFEGNEAHKATSSHIAALDSDHVTVWVRVFTNSLTANQQPFVQKAWSSHVTPFYSWSLMLTNTQWRWQVADATTTHNMLSTKNFALDTWFDVIAIYDGETQALHTRRLVTGEKARSTDGTLSGAIRHVANGITVGGYKNLAQDAPGVDIAGIAVWNYAFSDAQANRFLRDPFGALRLARLLAAPAVDESYSFIMRIWAHALRRRIRRRASF